MSAFDGYTSDFVRAIIKIADAADLAAKTYAKKAEQPNIVMNLTTNGDGYNVATAVRNTVADMLNKRPQDRR